MSEAVAFTEVSDPSNQKRGKPATGKIVKKNYISNINFNVWSIKYKNVEM